MKARVTRDKLFFYELGVFFLYNLPTMVGCVAFYFVERAACVALYSKQGLFSCRDGTRNYNRTTKPISEDFFARALLTVFYGFDNSAVAPWPTFAFAAA